MSAIETEMEYNDLMHNSASITIEAVYEDGVLKPQQPLPLEERQTVRVTIDPATSWTALTAGMLRWTGDLAELDQLALEPEADSQDQA